MMLATMSKEAYQLLLPGRDWVIALMGSNEADKYPDLLAGFRVKPSKARPIKKVPIDFKDFIISTKDGFEPNSLKKKPAEEKYMTLIKYMLTQKDSFSPVKN
ncbi:hypothetical protein HY086_05085 [Candidatus Gottesmanbacteria bacterium]|nr:hypothetical protein [Candidatus Gottesmanbacteria bacterium]